MSTSDADVPPPLPASDDGWAIFLDVDGTLLPIVDTPSALHDDPSLIRMLEELRDTCGGAVALISGRPLDNMQRLVGGLRLPMAGQHGLERRDPRGRVHCQPFDGRPLATVHAAAQEFARRHPGIELEDKGMSIAVHYRRAPQIADQLRATLAALVEAAGPSLALQPGKMVFEIKPAGWDKGATIREFMKEEPFLGRTPVFLGDDVTDEFGFGMVNDLDGISVKVGPGQTAACYRLPDVAAARRWLALLLDAKKEAV